MLQLCHCSTLNTYCRFFQNLRDNAESREPPANLILFSDWRFSHWRTPREPPANQILSTPFVTNLKQLSLFERINLWRTGWQSNPITRKSLNLISADVEVRSSEESICIIDFVLTLPYHTPERSIFDCQLSVSLFP